MLNLRRLLKEKMNNSPDSDWPRIRTSLVKSIEEMKATLEAFKAVSIIKEKTYSDLTVQIQQNLKNHHDALYGFTDNTGEWRDGIIKIVGDSEKRRKNMDKKVGWIIYGFLTALGIGFLDILIKFWKFITGQSSH